MEVGKRFTLGTGKKGQDTSKILGQHRETLEKEIILGGGNPKAAQITTLPSDDHNEEKKLGRAGIKATMEEDMDNAKTVSSTKNMTSDIVLSCLKQFLILPFRLMVLLL